MRDVFRDTHPEIVVIKGAQLGFSTTAMIRSFWMLTTWPCTVIYTFPTGKDVTKFTQSRINPLINGSTFLRARIVDVNSVGVKQFGVVPPGHDAEVGRYGRFVLPVSTPRSTLYFSGSASEKDATSVDADLLVHDEEDLSDPQIIEQFESRLDASKWKWKFRLSTPRLPGAGIDRTWKTTDQRKWLIRCAGCNAEFEMAFPGGPWDYSNIEPHSWEEYEKSGVARFVCHRCKRTITDDDRRQNGRWVVTAPSAVGRPHGYQVSQMAAPWIAPDRVLWRRYKSTWESDFWNLVMGIPWEEGTNVMTRDAILARAGGFAMWQSGSGCTMGVDVGAKMDVVIGRLAADGVPWTVHVGRYQTFADLDDLMKRFGVVACVIDAAPEEHMTREWAAKWNTPGYTRVWRSTYGGGGGRGPEVRWVEAEGLVSSPRTEILSKSSTELLSERVLPKYDGSEAYEAFLTHHVNSKRIVKFVPGLETQQVIDRYEWHEVGPDHLFHAATYEMLARMAPRQAMPPTIGLVSLSRGRDEARKEPLEVRSTSIRPPTR